MSDSKDKSFGLPLPGAPASSDAPPAPPKVGAKKKNTNGPLPVSELCGSTVSERAAHAAAGVLHKWDQHAHHMNGEMQLTKADYDAAIKATENGKYEPHKPALFERPKKVKK
jgi:hypothetical protein